MDKTKIIIVNENDEVTCYKFREDIKEDDIYRVSALWIENSSGSVLLAQRALSKKHSPGKWGPAVAGTVEEGETYESNIIKEAFEELGIRDFKFRVGEKRRGKSTRRFFSQRFYAIIDLDIKNFKVQQEEVERIKWFSHKNLVEEITKNPDDFLPIVKEIVLKQDK